MSNVKQVRSESILKQGVIQETERICRLVDDVHGDAQTIIESLKSFNLERVYAKIDKDMRRTVVKRSMTNLKKDHYQKVLGCVARNIDSVTKIDGILEYLNGLNLSVQDRHGFIVQVFGNFLDKIKGDKLNLYTGIRELSKLNEYLVEMDDAYIQRHVCPLVNRIPNYQWTITSESGHEITQFHFKPSYREHVKNTLARLKELCGITILSDPSVREQELEMVETFSINNSVDKVILLAPIFSPELGVSVDDFKDYKTRFAAYVANVLGGGDDAPRWMIRGLEQIVKNKPLDQVFNEFGVDNAKDLREILALIPGAFSYERLTELSPTTVSRNVWRSLRGEFMKYSQQLR